MQPDTTKIWTRAEIRVSVGKILVESLGVDEATVTDQAALVRDLGAESIDFLDISCEIERQFDVEVDFRRLFKARQAATGTATPDISVQDLVDYVKGLRSDAPA